MEEKKKIICIKNQCIYITSQDYLPFSHTNIPEHSLRFRSHEDIFWEIELLSYDPVEKSVIITITDYWPEDITSFYRQTMKKAINKLYFKSLRWSALEKRLSYYQKSSLLTLLEDEQETAVPRLTYPLEEDLSQEELLEEEFLNEDGEFSYPVLKELPTREPIKTKKHLKFTYPWTEVQFHPGYISLLKNHKDFDEPLYIRLNNPQIVPEFTYLVPFFEKLFKRKTLDVSVTVYSEDYAIQDIQAVSLQLNRINDQVIDQIRGMRLEKISGDHLTAKDKSFFTPEEMLEELEKLEPDLGNRFLPDPKQLLNELLLLKGAINAKQIMYLAGKLQQVDQKIRFSLEPYFGFVFFIEGK